MIFYTKRDFGKLVSDTFMFFKDNWKNYFKNYFLINGLLLILLVLILTFGYRELFAQLFSSNLGGESYYFETYFAENQGMLITVTSLLFIVFLALMIVSYSYPVLYMKRLSETGNKNITADTILGDIKNNSGRFLKLLLGLVFIVFPLALIIMGISYALLLIVIGFFLLLLVTPTVFNVINFLIYDYFHTDKSFFACLRYAVKSQFSYPKKNEKTPFWKYWGSTSVIYFIIQTATSIFTILPLVIYFTTSIIIPQSNGEMQGNPFAGGSAVLLIVIYTLSITTSLIFSNIQFVNAGFMYYDSRVDLHRKIDLSEIDTIGSNEE